MKKPYVFLGIVLVMVLGLAVTANAWAQEPAGHPARGKLTPTPQPTGDTIEPQIVGGQPADPAEYPWQVALVDAGTSNPLLGQFCGGSLIDPEWVLTAGHCVVQSGLVADASDIDIVLGINNLSDGPTSGLQGQRIAVDRIVPFASFNYLTFDSDVALLHLASPATLGPTVQTIALAGPGDSTYFEPGDTATITGWGRTSENGSGSNALLEVAIPIISNMICNAPSSYRGNITENMLCVGLSAGGKDACQGDSGGPLIVPNGSGGWLQAGVVSWGNGCARPNFYGVYSRISEFKGWTDLQTNGPSAIVHLPVVLQASASSPVTCMPSPPGESSNISDALTICSGQVVSGQVSESSDFDDVYRIWVNSGQRLTISMNGTGGDADLYLYPPGATDVFFDLPAAVSLNLGNTETIDSAVFNGGYWYVDIYSFSGSTSYNFTVTLSSP